MNKREFSSIEIEFDKENRTISAIGDNKNIIDVLKVRNIKITNIQFDNKNYVSFILDDLSIYDFQIKYENLLNLLQFLSSSKQEIIFERIEIIIYTKFILVYTIIISAIFSLIIIYNMISNNIEIGYIFVLIIPFFLVKKMANRHMKRQIVQKMSITRYLKELG